MTEEKTKRERSVNFSREETEQLVNLVEVHLRIIENKKSDSATWREKEDTWKNIQNKFNSFQIGPYREVKTLKIKYEGLKRETKRKCTLIRTKRLNNDFHDMPRLTTIEKRIREMILMTAADGDDEVFDENDEKITISGTVKVWDPRQRGKPVANMQPAKGETKRDCWSVAFGNSFNDAERIVAAGYDNGDLKMFDLRTMSLRWECNLKNGVCSTEFDRKDIPMNKLVATTLEGKFHVFDVRTQNPSKGFAQVLNNCAKSGTVWVARHLPQNRDIFVTCAGNGHVSLWKYEYPEQRHRVDAQNVAVGVPGKLNRLQRMVVSSQPINALDWNRDHLGLAVATAYDQCVRIIVTTKLNLQ